ncbi:MAG: DUF503 domain-containing protein [Myxococcota bacterium]
MIVAVCKFSLYLHGNRSLKGKRQSARRMIERLRNRFQVSIAEVEDHDKHQRLTLGFALVSNEGAHVQERLSRIFQAIESLQVGEVLNPQTEILHYNDDFGYDAPIQTWDQDDPTPSPGTPSWDEDWDLDAEEAQLQQQAPATADQNAQETAEQRAQDPKAPSKTPNP